MGLIDKAVDKFTGSSDTEEHDFEEEFEEPEPEPTFEEEDEMQEAVEWDTAYQFADDIIEEVGFVGVKEFIDKAMVYRIDMSPMYRDKIQSGVQTMDMISSSMGNIKELQGEFDNGGGPDYQEAAAEVKAANDLIDELDRMEGKEEQMANEVMGIARDFVDGMRERNDSGGSVDSTVGVSREN